MKNAVKGKKRNTTFELHVHMHRKLKQWQPKAKMTHNKRGVGDQGLPCRKKHTPMTNVCQVPFQNLAKNRLSFLIQYSAPGDFSGYSGFPFSTNTDILFVPDLT